MVLVDGALRLDARTLVPGDRGESNSIESTSAATSVISRLREPSPTAITNFPPEKLTILPFTLLPSFIRIVSANAPKPKQRTKTDEMDARTTFDLNDIIPPRACPVREEIIRKTLLRILPIGINKDANQSRFVGLKNLSELYIF